MDTNVAKGRTLVFAAMSTVIGVSLLTIFINILIGGIKVFWCSL